MKNLKNYLTKPDNDNKLWALWIWNKKVSEDEMEKQLNSFIEKGFGGVAIRPSRDMIPSYLSQEFLHLFGQALSIAKENGIKVRIADDFSISYDRFFHTIAEQHESYRGQKLKLDFYKTISSKEIFEFKISDKVEYVILSAKISNEKINPSTIKIIPKSQKSNIVSWKAPTGDWMIMVFKKVWYRDPYGCYVPNFFNPKVAHAYIHSVLEKMKKTFSKYTPSTFEGFLSEMPTYLPADKSIPWDDDLIIKYKSRYKKNLVTILPMLFFDVDDCYAKNRSHVYNFILHAMYERFSSVLETWSKKNRFSQWTLCPECDISKPDNVLRDMITIPSATLSSVGVQNQNGTDNNYPILRAMADSNTVEYSRETIAIIGRNYNGASATVQGLKAEIDQHIFMGASKIILDGCYFNLDQRNYIKSPFNPSWYHPDWDQMNNLCEYTARMLMFSKDTQRVRQVAVVLPSLSAMADYLPDNSESIKKARLVFKKVIDRLLSKNIEFDIVSEQYLINCTITASGEFGKSSKSRKGNYNTVIFPFSRLVSNSTFVFLEKLATKKGNIVFIDEAPQGNFDDGQNASFGARVSRLTRPKNKTIHSAPVEEFLQKLTHLIPAVDISVDGKECPDIYATHGYKESYHIWLFHNNSFKNDYFASIEFPSVNHVYYVDCLKGELIEVESTAGNEDKSTIKHNFLPKQTSLFVFSSTKIPGVGNKKGASPEMEVYKNTNKKYRVVLKNRWKFLPTTLNALPLATWNTRIGLSRDSGGFSHYYEAYFEIEEIPDTSLLVFCGSLNNNGIENEFEVSVNSMIAKAVHVVLPNENGDIPEEKDPLIEKFCGNTALKYDINGMIMKGINRVTIRTTGSIENPKALHYPPVVAGYFPIKKGPKGWIIKTQDTEIGYGSWSKYGYPYLSGSGVYEQLFEMPSEFDRLILRFENISGSASVEVNEKSFGIVKWQPFAVDITEIVEPRRNQLKIEVVNTIDNLLRMNGRASGLVGEVFLDIY